MKITSTKGLSPLIAIIIVALVIGTGIIVYQSSKPRNETITAVTSTTLGTEATPTTVLSPTTTITIPTSPTTFCLDWEFFKDPKNYDDGQPHEEIKVIQEKLGVTPVGGHYGPLTKAALDRLNKDYNIIIPASGCCGNIIEPAHLAKGLTELTLIKFNDLYCSLPKPKVTITLINYPTQGEDKIHEAVYTYIMPNGYYDNKNKIKIEPSGTNITVKTIEATYSGSIKILPSYSESYALYYDNTLIFRKGDPAGISIYLNDLSTYGINYDVTGDDSFTWRGIKGNHNIKFKFGE